MKLYSHQEEALSKVHNGSILCGDTGSGKSLVGLVYYWQKHRGLPLYIITTARKRDTNEWESDIGKTGFCIEAKVDSWNNIQKYKEVRGAFFLFDEQKACGSGPWAKTFVSIARKNYWIMLTATPGDVWMDYVPVFLAHGFYKNKSQFIVRHVVFNPYTKYQQVQRYLEENVLENHLNEIIVRMDDCRKVRRHYITRKAGYDKTVYDSVSKSRWNPYTQEPIASASAYCGLLRKIANDNLSRTLVLREILIAREHKAIVFYNFDYELDRLVRFAKDNGYEYGQWNGHLHEELPTGKKWIYLVQYTAGSEGWNCITCNTVVLYSQNYSYKTTKQALGRIDRINTPYSDLYFYTILSDAPIDKAIQRAIQNKQQFNESNFASLQPSRQKHTVI